MARPFRSAPSTRPAALHAPATSHGADPTFTFQVQDDGGTANGGVDTDATVRDDHAALAVNGISVNDAPAGADKTVTTLENATYTFPAADFGFTDPQRQSGQQPAGREDHDAAGASLGMLIDNGIAVTAGPFVPVSDITTGNLRFVPAGNVTGSAQITFQVQDDGGTVGGGVDLDQSAQHADDRHHARSTTLPPAPTTRSRTLEDTAYTFTAADFGSPTAQRFAGQHAEGRQDHALPAAGTLIQQQRAVFAGQFVTGQRHRQPAASSSSRPPTPTARPTPASPSRCRTTAARPMAASISTRPPTR